MLATIQTLYCRAPMYADDLSLVTDSPDWQCWIYAKRWRYPLNGVKLVVMVFGEPSSSRMVAQSIREWRSAIQYCRKLMSNTTYALCRAPPSIELQKEPHQAEVHFFALNSVGSHFRCLHPSKIVQFPMYANSAVWLQAMDPL